ncbi:hypothetical protein, partial [Wohlfahrtiimonas larvae]|uniref:hypothetical protein n=1 Tax=Wohlfahrtiimonas larvae TaxID=1157986 RepID=UPI0031E6A9A5
NQLGNVWQVVSFFLKAVATGSETVVSGLKFLVDLAFDNENAWGKVITVWDELGMNVKQFWSDIPTWAQPAIDKVMAILQPFLDVYNHLTGKKPEFTVSQKLIHDYNTNPKAFNSHYLNKFNELNEKVPGLDKVVSQEQYLKAMQRGEEDEIKAKVLEFQRNAQEVKNQTQTNTFQIHITAPDGNASNIAEAVKRGIASVTKNNDAFLGDTV